MVTLNVVFDAGSARDPQGRNGLSMLTNHLLDNGTGELDADAIAATFEGLGAEFGSSNDRDMAGVSLRSLSDHALLDPALDLFARVLAAPSFPATSFERERQRALARPQAGRGLGGRCRRQGVSLLSSTRATRTHCRRKAAKPASRR